MPLLAPIVLFTFKRLDTLKQTVEALSKNYLAANSDLYIFSDAARSEKDKEAIDSVREYIGSINGFKKVVVFEAEINKGLATSIIDGVSYVLTMHENVIVLEDDLVTSKNFLNFMNASLEFYKFNKEIISICGFSFPYKSISKEDVYFLNRFWPWGWATWSNRWEFVDWDVKDYAQFKSNKIKRKQFSNLGSDVNAMLDKQMNGNLDSWAIRWTYHIFKNQGLVLYPDRSKISNEGFDEFATNTVGLKNRYVTKIDIDEQVDFKFIEETKINDGRQAEFLKKFGIKARIINKMKELLLRNS
jgi:hypothetical protein